MQTLLRMTPTGLEELQVVNNALVWPPEPISLSHKIHSAGMSKIQSENPEQSYEILVGPSTIRIVHVPFAKLSEKGNE